LSEDTGVGLQLQHRWSPLWSGTVSAGPSWTRARGRTDQGLVYSAQLSRAVERWSLAAMASRALAPNGIQRISERDDLSLQFSARLSERLDGSLSLASVRSRELLPALGLTGADVRYDRLAASLSWHVARNWSLVALASTARQRVGASAATAQGNDATARSNEASLAVRWDGDAHVY
jgi:hypothetical protein